MAHTMLLGLPEYTDGHAGIFIEMPRREEEEELCWCHARHTTTSKDLMSYTPPSCEFDIHSVGLFFFLVYYLRHLEVDFSTDGSSDVCFLCLS